MIPPEHPALAALLTPPSLLYAAGVRLRNRFYDRPGASARAGVPVLSVGNLTVGGTGKTPVVAWLVRRLQEHELRAAVVSRGYGGRTGKGPLLVSDGQGPRVPAERCGDEPYMLARTLAGAMVIVGSDRLAGARAAARSGADVVVLDDGFQHRRLARDLDVVLIDGGRSLGGHRLLPAGALREPVSALRRADVVLVTRCHAPSSFELIERVVRRYNSTAPVLRSVHRAVGFVDLRGDKVAAPARAVAFCAIGNPSSFRDDLSAQGVELVLFRPFRDHHPFTPGELRVLQQEADQRDAALVTTEKDLARLVPWAGLFQKRQPVALRIEPEIQDDHALITAVRSALSGVGQ